MPSRILGEGTKPRALIFGLDEAMAERVGALFGSWKLIGDLSEVDQQEWDVLVTTKSLVQAEQHLYVIAVGCDGYGTAQPTPSAFGPFHDPNEPDNTYKGWVVFTGSSRAKEYEIPADLSASIARMIESK